MTSELICIFMIYKRDAVAPPLMDILLYAKVSLLYNVLWECIVVVYT